LEPAGGELEIFAPEQIGVGEEERPDIHDGHEEQHQGDEIDQERQAREAKPVEKRPPERQGPAGRIARKIHPLDHLGDIVQEVAGHDGGGHGQKVGEDDEQAGAGKEECEALEQRIIGCRELVLQKPVEQAREGEPGQCQKRDRQGERFPEHAPQGRRENLAPGGEPCLNQHHGALLRTEAAGTQAGDRALVQVPVEVRLMRKAARASDQTGSSIAWSLLKAAAGL